MTTVSVVYHSGMGHTKKMAEAVAKGAGDVDGVEVHLIAIDGKDKAPNEVDKRTGEALGRRVAEVTKRLGP